ncbi:MAG: tetratricopeptide repeat protein, partial [Bacteroidetes bacterium]|nr:tetratricopeptide repeat protein [Bacteroidota bacterium]
MKKLILSILFFQFSLISYSQDTIKEIFEQAIKLKKNGKYQEALIKYDKVLLIKPKFVNALINRANLKSLLNDNSGALTDLNEAEKIDPSEPEIYYNRGNVEHDITMYEDAIRDYNKAISFKEHEDYYLARGNSKKAVGEYKEAIEDYSKAIEINATFKDGYYNRGNTKKKLGDLVGAVEDYNKIIKINPKNSKAYTNRGNAKMAMTDDEGAILDYTTSIELEPSNPILYSNRAISYGHLKKYELAIKEYNKSIELNPENPDAFFGRAGIKHYLDDKVGECEDLKKSADLGFE